MKKQTQQHSADKQVQKDNVQSVTYLEPALWKKLTDSQTDGEFCHYWLMLQCRIIEHSFGGIVFWESTPLAPLAVVSHFPADLKNPPRFSPIVEKVIEEKKGFVLRSADEGEKESPHAPSYYLAYPLFVFDTMRGVAAIEISQRPADQLQAAMRQLQWGVTWLENRLLQHQAEPDAKVRQRQMTVLELSAAALEAESFKSASSVTVTELATRFDCDRVSVGFVEKKRARVKSVSHSAQFGKQMNLIRAIEEAMDESIDQKTTLVISPDKKEEDHIFRAHSELSHSHGSGAILTIPFLDTHGSGFGALTLERMAEFPFDDENVKLCEAVAALIGPILDEKRKTDSPLFSKIKESIGAQAGKLIGPGHLVLKGVVLILLITIGILTFVEGDYRVTAATSLEGTIQRAVISPFAGYLAEANVRAGDVVKEDQVMASLDTRDLFLEKLKKVSEKDQLVLGYRRTIADGDIAAAKINQEQIRQAESQLNILEEQIARASITAPFEGVVISGDLSQSVGAPLEIGQILFEIAPLHSYRVMLEIDEREIKAIRNGQHGELILSALPNEKFAFSVQRITPVSTPEEGRNYFLVEAVLDNDPTNLLPGMEGFGKVSIGRHKLIWIWTHEMTDWIRLWFWSWWP